MKLSQIIFGTLFFVVIMGISSGCNYPEVSFSSPAPTITNTLQTRTPAISVTSTMTTTASPTNTETATVEPSFTPTISPTATPSPSPTFAFPVGVVNVDQAFCRYGPGKAYLYSHGLYRGDKVIIHNRNKYGTWVWVIPETLDRHCWVAVSVLDITGDVFSVVEYYHPLPKTTFSGPPTGVSAIREGNEVTIRWNPINVPPEDARGYLIEVMVCQGGYLIEMAVQTDKYQYTFTDEAGCPLPSQGLLYGVEKHGYTDPVSIPWP